MKLLVAVLLPFTAFTALATDVAKEERERPIAEENLPHPESVGLVMLPNSKAVVAGIECHAPGATAGIMDMDRIVEVDGKRVGTVLEFRRALHDARQKRSIKVVVVSGLVRNGRKKTVTIKLPPNWADKRLGRDR